MSSLRTLGVTGVQVVVVPRALFGAACRVFFLADDGSRRDAGVEGRRSRTGWHFRPPKRTHGPVFDLRGLPKRSDHGCNQVIAQDGTTIAELLAAGSSLLKLKHDDDVFSIVPDPAPGAAVIGLQLTRGDDPVAAFSMPTAEIGRLELTDPDCDIDARVAIATCVDLHAYFAEGSDDIASGMPVEAW